MDVILKVLQRINTPVIRMIVELGTLLVFLKKNRVAKCDKRKDEENMCELLVSNINTWMISNSGKQFDSTLREAGVSSSIEQESQDVLKTVFTVYAEVIDSKSKIMRAKFEEYLGLFGGKLLQNAPTLASTVVARPVVSQGLTTPASNAPRGGNNNNSHLENELNAILSLCREKW